MRGETKVGQRIFYFFSPKNKIIREVLYFGDNHPDFH